MNTKKKELNFLFNLLFFAALVLLVIRIYLKRTGKTDVAGLIGFVCLALLTASFLARFIVKFFPKKFDKATREQMDIKVHRDKN